MRLLVLTALAVAACRQPAKAPERTVAAAPIAPIQLDSKVALALFNNDSIVQCIDVHAFGPRRDGGSVDNSDLHQRMIKAFDPKKTLVELPRSCAEELGDRPIFATCEWSGTPKDAATIELKEHFLGFEDVFANDRAMRDCLEMKATWRSMDRRSPAFLEARLRADQAKYERRARKALKAAGVDPSNAGFD